MIGNVNGGDAAYTVDVMPRWFASDSLAFCPRVTHVQGDSTMVGLEVHHIASAGRFALTSNVGWHPTVGADGVGLGDMVLLVGPEIFFTQRLSVAAEVDVTTPVGDASATSAALAPALSAIFDRAGMQSAAIGAIVPVWPERGSPTMGAWYSFGFGTSGRGIAADSQ